MPELPEVEVVKRSLKSKIQNLLIKRVVIKDKNLRYKIIKEESSKLYGLKIIKIERRSKYLLFFFNKPIVMLVHLGMTGKFFFVNHKNKKFKTSFYYNLDNTKDDKHNHVIIYFKNDKKLIYNDVRKFGFIKFLDFKNHRENFHLKNLGPEPLTEKYNFKYFKIYIERRSRSIKDILMDQKFVSGLGNIYVNEILFFSKINPPRKVKTLNDNEINKIIFYSKKILKDAIKFGGSSIKDFSSIDGKQGAFQGNFKVYGKKGKNCSNSDCNSFIKKIVLSNRASFYCPNCQK